jgi:hypothetical protein
MGGGERNNDEAHEGKIESGELHLRSHVHAISLPTGPGPGLGTGSGATSVLIQTFSSLLVQGSRQPVIPMIIVSTNNPFGHDASLLFSEIYDPPSPEKTRKPERKKSLGSLQKSSQRSLLVPVAPLQLNEELPETYVDDIQRFFQQENTQIAGPALRKPSTTFVGTEEIWTLSWYPSSRTPDD